MKFSRVLVLYLSLMVAPSALAAPLWHGGRCSPGSADVRCIGHEDDHGRIPDSHSSARGVMPIHERQLSQTLKSILEGLPIIGPILAPLLGSLLGAIGLSELNVASASDTSLNAEQIAALANFEFALSNAVHKVLSPGGTPEGGAQSKLKARGVVPLGELTTGVPIIGAFLRPFVLLLEALKLDSVDAETNSVFSLALLNEEQSTKLAQFQTILRQEYAEFLPNVTDSSPPGATLPSKSSPDDTKPSQAPSPNTSDGDDSGSDAPSPDDASPADASPTPDQALDGDEPGRS